MKLMTKEDIQRIRGEQACALSTRLYDLQMFQRALSTPSEEIAAEIKGIEWRLEEIKAANERDELIANMPTDWRFLSKFMLCIFAAAAILVALLSRYIR